MKITGIAAMDIGHGIGVLNELPWPRLRKDMENFKAATMGKPLIVGRATYDSFGGRPLIGRELIVLSRSPGFAPKGAHLANSIDKALTIASAYGNEVMIGGGAQIYRAFEPRMDRMLLTLVMGTFFCDTHLQLDWGRWNARVLVQHDPDEKTPFALSFLEMLPAVRTPLPIAASSGNAG